MRTVYLCNSWRLSLSSFLFSARASIDELESTKEVQWFIVTSYEKYSGDELIISATDIAPEEGLQTNTLKKWNVLTCPSQTHTSELKVLATSLLGSCTRALIVLSVHKVNICHLCKHATLATLVRFPNSEPYESYLNQDLQDLPISV